MAEADDETELNASDEAEVEERRQLSALIVYETVRREGKDELERPASSLWWSGVTAGLGMGLSLACQAALHDGLPDAPFRHIVESFGYAVGFLVVILSRHQLFTENTLTAVLPVLHPPMGQHLGALLRLWGIVLLANLVGTALFAAAFATEGIFPASLQHAMGEIAGHLKDLSAGQIFWRAIVGGWIVAAVVWMLPSAETGKIWIIIIFTALISLLELTHVIAGATEIFLLVFTQRLDIGAAVVAYILPMLVGNIIGGSALFALLSFGQVKEEIEESQGKE